MKRLWLGLVICAEACGNSTGPSFPTLAGTYATIFSVNFTNSVDTRSGTAPGTMTLNAPGSDGSFNGSYIFTGGGSGTITGVERMDGGVSITHFGDPNQSPLEAVAYLQQTFYWCDFTQAAAQAVSGSVAGKTLTFSGSLILPCTYTDGTNIFTYSTTITFGAAGTRS
jgi:hypothetical protein